LLQFLHLELTCYNEPKCHTMFDIYQVYCTMFKNHYIQWNRMVYNVQMSYNEQWDTMIYQMGYNDIQCANELQWTMRYNDIQCTNDLQC
jgi:hypothetical protein